MERQFTKNERILVSVLIVVISVSLVYTFLSPTGFVILQDAGKIRELQPTFALQRDETGIKPEIELLLQERDENSALLFIGEQTAEIETNFSSGLEDVNVTRLDVIVYWQALEASNADENVEQTLENIQDTLKELIEDVNNLQVLDENAGDVNNVIPVADVNGAIPGDENAVSEVVVEEIIVDENSDEEIIGDENTEGVKDASVDDENGDEEIIIDPVIDANASVQGKSAGMVQATFKLWNGKEWIAIPQCKKVIVGNAFEEVTCSMQDVDAETLKNFRISIVFTANKGNHVVVIDEIKARVFYTEEKEEDVIDIPDENVEEPVIDEPIVDEPVDENVDVVLETILTAEDAFSIEDSQGNHFVKNFEVEKNGNSVTGIIEKGKYKTRVVLPETGFEEIVLEDVTLTGKEKLRVEENVDAGKNVLLGIEWKDLYALDPSGLNFSQGILKRVAKGDALYKCVEWNFLESTCEGNWEKKQDLISGESYAVNFNAVDPGYGEGNPSTGTNFDRDNECQGCGPFRAPGLAGITETVSVSFEGTVEDAVLTDYVPKDWNVFDANFGIITDVNAEFWRIDWNVGTVTGEVSRTYTATTPWPTTPITEYDFITEFNGETSERWGIRVTDVRDLTGVTMGTPTADQSLVVDIGDLRVQCTPTSSGGGPSYDVTTTLQQCNDADCTAPETMPTDDDTNVLTVDSGTSVDANPVTQAYNITADFNAEAKQVGAKWIRCQVFATGKTCSPASPCYSSTYKITVGGTPGKVIAYAPLMHATNVDIASNIVINFDNNVSIHTIDDTNIPVFSDFNGVLAGAYSYDYDNNIVTFNPTNNFFYGDRITVVVSSGVVQNKDGVTGYDLNELVFDVNFGDNNGQFVQGDDYNFPITNRNFFARDLDLDGNMDLIGLNGTIDELYSMLGNGDGTFNATNVKAITGSPWFLSVGDINGDGKLDAVIGSGGGDIKKFFGNGDGTFQSELTETGGTQNTGTFLADFDGDGKLDLLTSEKTGAQSGGINIWIGTGDGNFNDPIHYAGNDEQDRQVHAFDFENDGDIDVMAGAVNDDKIAMWLNQGDGTFGSVIDYAVGDSPRGMRSSDLDGDGFMDFANISLNDNTMRIFRNDKNGTFTDVNSFVLPDIGENFSLADVNGDGLADLIIPTDTNNSIAVYLNDGNNVFTFTFDRYYLVGAGTYIGTVVANFDNDADADIVVPAGTDGNITIFLGQTDAAAGGPADISFTLAYPATGCALNQGCQTGGCSACTYCYFEATELAGATDENQVSCNGQTSSVPFFVLSNTGDTTFDWTMDLNANPPSQFVVKISQVDTGYEAGCTGTTSSGCADVNADSNATIATSIGASNDQNAWMWSDFINAFPGDGVDRNATSTSTAS